MLCGKVPVGLCFFALLALAGALPRGGCKAGGAEALSLNNTIGLLEESQEHEKVSEIAGQVVLPCVFAIMLTLVLSAQVERCHLSFLPESAVVIAIGVMLGALLIASFGFEEIVESKLLHHWSAPALNLAFLPIIIFESGWTLRWRDFAAQLQYILVFAVIGSLISMAVVGALFHATADTHGITSWRTAYAYASLIAATDPVATLATYSALKVEPLLNVMVFGESTINDAVAIVVFDIMNSDTIFGDGCSDTPTGSVMQEIGIGVLQKLFGSILVGVGLAIIYTLVLRFADLQHSQLMEILYILMSCYLTFAAAEELKCSGIIATLFCSMVMGIYTKPHLSKEGLPLATFMVKGVAMLADTGIFLLVGVDVMAVNGLSLTISFLVMAFCIVGRLAAIVPCGLAVNLWKSIHGRSQELEKDRWNLLSWKHLFMMWHAGLRGGIALVLALELGDFVDNTDGPGTKQRLVNCTIMVIVVFLLVFGGSTQCFLKLLGIKMGEEYPENFLYSTSLLTCTRSCGSFIHGKCLWPMLVGGKPPHIDAEPPADFQDLSTSAQEPSYSPPSDLHGVLQSIGGSHRHHAFYKGSSKLSLVVEEDEEGSSDSSG